MIAKYNWHVQKKGHNQKYTQVRSVEPGTPEERCIILQIDPEMCSSESRLF